MQNNKKKNIYRPSNGLAEKIHFAIAHEQAELRNNVNDSEV
jgi:hypothetical protein